jgi:hypothetical protein
LLTLETNNVLNQDQQLLNLTQGQGISIVDDGAGEIVFSVLPTILPPTYNKFVTVYYDYSTGGIPQVGCSTPVPTSNSTGHTSVAPSAIDGGSITLIGPATASLNAGIGISQGQNSNIGQYGFGQMKQWLLRFAAATNTNSRFWLGLAVFDSGGSGTNTQNLITTSSMASDTPNRTFVAFRFSAGTDTTWKAMSGVAGGSAHTQIVDTGIAIDTNIHNFQIFFDGSNYTFYIDSVLVASLVANGTTAPVASVYKMMMFWCGDNQDSAHANSGTFYYMTMYQA